MKRSLMLAGMAAASFELCSCAGGMPPQNAEPISSSLTIPSIPLNGTLPENFQGDQLAYQNTIERWPVGTKLTYQGFLSADRISDTITASPGLDTERRSPANAYFTRQVVMRSGAKALEDALIVNGIRRDVSTGPYDFKILFPRNRSQDVTFRRELGNGNHVLFRNQPNTVSLSAGGKSYQCNLEETYVSLMGTRRKTQVAVSPDVPGGVVSAQGMFRLPSAVQSFDDVWRFELISIQ